jgi:hypothetical protein
MNRRSSSCFASLLLVGWLVAGCGEDQGPSNQLPTLFGPIARATDVVAGAQVALELEANDPDGDSVTYAWTQTPAAPAGSFSDASAASPTWTAPQVTQSTLFQLNVAVTDGDGGTARGSVRVLVRPAPPANRPPVLAQPPRATPASVMGSVPVQLALNVTDADQDPLTYNWTQEPATPVGSFSSIFAANPMWISPEVSSPQTFTLRVTVTDGKGGSVQGQVTVDVAPPSSTNRTPTLTSGPNASVTTLNSRQSTNLSVGAADPDGDTLVYAWTQSPATPAGAFTNTALTNPSWTAPVVAAETPFQLRITVSDGKGGTVSSSVTVTVRPLPNQVPTISAGPSATPTSVTGPAPVQLAVTASDPDGDMLTYAWTQTAPATPTGSFSNTTLTNPIWTAPAVTTNTRFTLRVTVSDPRGGTVQGTVNVDVLAPPNNAPVLTGPTASATTVNEQTSITLTSSATDADGDPITYAWAQTSPASPMGSFSSTTVAGPTWTAPDVTASGTYTLRVIASDGKGGNTPGTINITVNKVNQVPTVAASITGPTTLIAGDTGSFSITASDPDGDPLTYSWDQTAPATQGTWVGSRTASSAQWFSPAIGANTTFTLAVSVTDGQSAPVVRTIDVLVTVPPYTAVQNVWTGTCTGCHGTSGGLDLAAGASHGNLVGVAAGACAPTLRVVAGDPDNSALIQKMTGTTCGDRMPRSSPTYFDDNPGLVVRVRSWILAGANND